MQKFIIRIDSSFAAPQQSEAECFALNAALEEDFCRKFVEKNTAEGKITLFYGDKAIERAKYFGVDGVILDLGCDEVKEKLAAVRKQLGKGRVVGLFTRNRRHESMIVSEAEPDFVIFRVWKDGFDKVKELTDWYADFFLIQSAAWVMEDEVDTTVLRTDFVIA